MLVRVAEDPRRVVCPIIDVISMENFDYIGGIYFILFFFFHFFHTLVVGFVFF